MNNHLPIKKRFSLSNILWDIWCIASVIGIWPRYIEPKLISITQLPLKISKLHPSLNHLKILQFSDLHFQKCTSASLLKKLSAKIQSCNPDIIVFTGDFLCSSQLQDPNRLTEFLCSLKAPYGCYAILGNHDYQHYVSITQNGDYDVIDNKSVTMRKGWKRLLSTITLTKRTTPRAAEVPLNNNLVNLLKKTPFILLHNETSIVPIRDTFINICGVGEYVLNRCEPKIAFKNYNKNFPGIVLAHNPDGVPKLLEYPGDIILCGHTHGGQINLPWMWKKFTLLENFNLKRGLKSLRNKTIYINRGVGAVMPFRWFSIPELTLITLEPSHE
jgi:predicted MPP superfamily phosphohydrolase